jgi:hypothetical protein
MPFEDVDRLLASFEKDLGVMFTAFTNRVKQQLSVAGILERADIDKILVELGYAQLLIGFQDEAINVVTRATSPLLRELGLTELGDNSLAKLELVTRNSMSKLLNANTTIIDSMVESGIAYEVEGLPFNEIIQRMEKQIADMSRRVVAEANTGIANYQRALRLEMYEEGGIERFIYHGPVDGKTRDICLSAMTSPNQTKGWTRAEIASAPVDMIGGGGYNCRHEFLPLDKEIGGQLQRRAKREEVRRVK